jgi:HSP20 family protein
MVDENDGAENPIINPDELNAVISKLIKELSSNQNLFNASKPFSYGLNIRVDSNGITVTNALHGGTPQQQPQKAKELEPLIDMIDRGEELVLLAEMPGAEPDSISVSSDSSTIAISASGRHNFSKIIQLDSHVDPRKAKARYNNGVLELILKKSDKYKGDSVEITIK